MLFRRLRTDDEQTGTNPQVLVNAVIVHVDFELRATRLIIRLRLPNVRKT